MFILHAMKILNLSSVFFFFITNNNNKSVDFIFKLFILSGC